MLPQVNIWLDVIGWVAIVGMSAVFLGAYLPTNIISGRFKQKFVDKNWWYLKAMHEPLSKEYVNVVYMRTWHWINLISFLAFFITGFYIRYPYFEAGRLLMRNIHLTAAYINIVNFVYRLYWTMTGPDRKNFKFDRSDIHTMIENTKYYLYLSKSYPHEKKFHPAQRGVYIVMALLFAVMIFTGACLLWPTVLLGPVSGLLGGVAAGAAWMRVVHATVFRLLLLIVIAHAFLGIMETWPTLKFFWFGIQSPELIEATEYIESHAHGHDDHGGGHGDGEHEKEHPEEPILIPTNSEDELPETVLAEESTGAEAEMENADGKHEEEN